MKEKIERGTAKLNKKLLNKIEQLKADYPENKVCVIWERVIEFGIEQFRKIFPK